MSRKRDKLAKPIRVADLLTGLFHGQPLEKRLREARIWDIWEEAVGAQIAAKAQPAKFQAGTLTVAVATPPWMQQLTYLRQEMIRKLNNLLGEELITEIYLKAGKIETASPRKSQPAPPRPLSSEEIVWIEAVSSELDDPQLGKAFRQLLTRHLQNPAE